MINRFTLRSKIYVCFQTCASHYLHSSTYLPVVNQFHSMFGLASFAAFQSRMCPMIDMFIRFNRIIQIPFISPFPLCSVSFRFSVGIPPLPLLTWMCIQQLWECCLSVLQGTSRLHLLRIVFVQRGLWGRGPAEDYLPTYLPYLS